MKTNKYLILLLMIGFSSCESSEYPTEQTKWVIEQIKTNKTNKVNGTTLYFAVPINPKDLNCNETWFVDSIGKFNPGDTVSFQAYK